MAETGCPEMLRALLALLLLAAPAAAQERYPNHPIRLVVVFGPGGGADTTARLMAGPMGQVLGQPVLVENRSGAGGMQGGQVVAQAAPDGYTLMADASAFVVRHKLFANLGFDYERDFTPVARLSVMPLLLVVPPAERAATLADYIATLRAAAQPLHYAVAGIGSASHFAGLYFLQRIGVRGEAVAYRGGSSGAMAVVTGETRLNFATTPSAVGLVQGGRLRALAVSSERRMQVLPEVPAVAETLPGFDLTEWIGLYAPAHTPAAELAKLHAAVRHAMAQPEVAARLADVGAEPALLEGEPFARFVTEQRVLMGGLADAAGLKPE
jgi:tripartite-type tricarboxylate transporter receptor subunit TctC